MIFLPLIGVLWVATAHAEPYAQIPLSEFKMMVSNVDKLQKREKLQVELIAHLREKDGIQTEYITKIEQANDTIQAYATKLEEHNEKLEQLANDPRWAERAEYAGYGAAVPIVVQLLRKLILKF